MYDMAPCCMVPCAVWRNAVLDMTSCAVWRGIHAMYDMCEHHALYEPKCATWQPCAVEHGAVLWLVLYDMNMRVCVVLRCMVSCDI